MLMFTMLHCTRVQPCCLLGERLYDPRPYDSRYARDYRDDRRGGRYDDSRGGGGGGRYDDRDRHYGRGGRDRDR